MAASAIPKLAAHPNVLVLRTFSKSYSMAGGRLGLCFGSAELIANMGKVKDSYNVNALTQIAGAPPRGTDVVGRAAGWGCDGWAAGWGCDGAGGGMGMHSGIRACGLGWLGGGVVG